MTVSEEDLATPRRKFYCDVAPKESKACIDLYGKYVAETCHNNSVKNIYKGWTFGQLGTAFLDIQLILDASMKETSLQLTLGSIGYMTGSLVIGAIFDRVNKLLLLCLASLVVAGISTALPYCTQFWLFMFLRFICGVCAGGLNAGGNAKVASSWGNDMAQYIQALHFCYAFGGIISPLVTSPFMAPRIPANCTSWGDTTTAATEEKDDCDSDTDVILFGETRIHYAFIITGILMFISAFLYFVVFMKGYDNIEPYRNAKTDSVVKVEDIEANTKRVTMTPFPMVMFMVVYGLTVLTYCTLELKLQSLLMSFVMTRFDWTKSNGAKLTSLLWGLYGFGRLAGVPISRYLSATAIIMIFLCCTIFSSVGILVGALLKSDASLWVFIPLSGMSISVLFPTFIVWAAENVIRISGKVAAFFIVMASVGFIIDPLYMGTLMDDYSPMYFAYVQVGQAILCLSLFCVSYCVIRHLRTLEKDNTIP